MKHRRERRDRGVVLLVSLGVLVILSTLGITFVRMTSHEREGSVNYVNYIRAKMLAESGIRHAMAKLQQRAINQHWETLQPADKQMKGSIGPGTFKKDGDTFEVVIKDSASMLNINHGDDRLARMLDNLGRAISPTDPPIKAGEGQRIIAWRNLQPGKKFYRLEDLLHVPGDIISQGDFQRIREYLTIRSWVDKSTVKPPEESTQPKDGELLYKKYSPGKIEFEPRPPVNINTASKPVLTALLTGLEAGWTDYSRVDDKTDSEKYWAWYRNRKKPMPIGRRRRVKPISFETAQKIAHAIIVNRNTKAGAGKAPYVGPFRSWKQFELFIDSFVNGADQQITRASAFRLLVVRGNIALDAWGGKSYTSYYFGQTKESTGGRPWEVWGVGDQGEGFYCHIPRLALLWGYASFVGSPMTIIMDRPEGKYEISTRGVAYRTWGYMLSYLFPERIVFTPSSARDVTLSNEEADMLKAAFNPNTMLNKYNPDAVRYRRIDKTDLITYSTEFSFNSGGEYEILSRGTIAGPHGEPAARSLIAAYVTLYDTYVQTTQADFSQGEISRASTSPVPLKDGKALVSYPQPGIKKLPESCREDGYLMLSHYEPKMPSQTFAARFSKDFDADSSGGSARMQPDSKGPVAGDLFSVGAAGHLYPDGVYSEREHCPAWRMLGNMDGLVGTISFWVKPNWSGNDEAKNHHLFAASHSNTTWVDTQTFQLGYFGWLGNILGIQTEAAHVSRDWLNERVAGARLSPRAHHWIHVVFQYSLGTHQFDEAIYLQINGKEARDFRGYTWPGSPTEIEDLSLNNNVFRLGERPEYIDYVINPSVPADATFDELVITRGIMSRASMRSMYLLGRYYNGGDATYTSHALPWNGLVPISGTSKLPVKGRLASIAWTRYLPYSVPGAEVTFRVRNGSKWIDVTPSEGGGSLGGERITGDVYYQAKFVETARAFFQPLVESPVLDDVRITVLRDPVISQWEHVFDGDDRFENAQAVIQGSLDVGGEPPGQPDAIIIMPKAQIPQVIGMRADQAGDNLNAQGGGILPQILGQNKGGNGGEAAMIQKAFNAPGGRQAPGGLAERAEQKDVRNWRNSIKQHEEDKSDGDEDADKKKKKKAKKDSAGNGDGSGGSGGSRTVISTGGGNSGGGGSRFRDDSGAGGSGSGGGGDEEGGRFSDKQAKRHDAANIVLKVVRKQGKKEVPIRGAAVSVYRKGGRVFSGMRTDRKGQARLLLLTNKKYELKVERPGYEKTEKTLTPRWDTKEVKVVLKPEKKKQAVKRQ